MRSDLNARIGEELLDHSLVAFVHCVQERIYSVPGRPIYVRPDLKQRLHAAEVPTEAPERQWHVAIAVVCVHLRVRSQERLDDRVMALARDHRQLDQYAMDLGLGKRWRTISVAMCKGRSPWGVISLT